MKSNLPVNVASALCYVPFVGWIAAIVFLIIENEQSVRFNAIQGLLLMLALWLLSFLMGVTIILLVLTPLVWIGGLILQIVVAVKVYNGEKVELPVVAKWSNQVLGKLAAAKK